LIINAIRKRYTRDVKIYTSIIRSAIRKLCENDSLLFLTKIFFI